MCVYAYAIRLTYISTNSVSIKTGQASFIKN